MPLPATSRHVPELVRHHGLGWVAFRAWHAAKVRSGWFARRWPIREWASRPLEQLLDDPALSEPEAYLAYRRTRAPRFFFGSSDAGLYRKLLPQWDTPDTNPILQAQRMARGEFPFFSRTWHQCGVPPEWHRDYFADKSGFAAGTGVSNDSQKTAAKPKVEERWNKQLGGQFRGSQSTGLGLESEHWSRIDHFAQGDVKCVWELSRFTFAYTLVRAYWRDGDDGWAELFWRLVEDWRVHNLPNQGPQWMCGQETAFRAMAWCFALHGFLGSPATTPARLLMLVQMLAVSGERIAANMNYALSQANNHGISEALGLWTIGALFPELRSSAPWEKSGRHWIERLGRKLIYDDGGFSQHSANYHRVMLHDYLWALRLGDLIGRPFSRELRERVLRAGEFLYQLQDPRSGNAPCYGANDGALVLPLNNCDYEDFRPVLQAVTALTCTETGLPGDGPRPANAARANGRPPPQKGERRFGPGPWDEDLLWLFGPDSLDAPVVSEDRKPFTAIQSGFRTMLGRDSYAVLRCPTGFRHRPSHADLLHLDLWWRGMNVALDPGTFSYNAPPPWADSFAGTIWHNTVTVDNQDQMQRAGRFLWLPWRACDFVDSRRSQNGRLTCVEAAFEWCTVARQEPRPTARQPDTVGRATLPRSRLFLGRWRGQRVVHKRTILLAGNSAWFVLDRLEARESHEFRLHWLLSDVPFEEQPETGELTLFTAAGPFHCCVRSSEEVTSSLVRADTGSARGWRSPCYQELKPALSWASVTRGAGCWFASVFSDTKTQLQKASKGWVVTAAEWRMALETEEVTGQPSVRRATYCGTDGTEDTLTC